jgi:uncharacterized protein
VKNPIPEPALKKHIAILGMNGSGKTSVAKSQIIEPALKAGMRVCNIDPTGVGWGLRLRADGRTKGFDIYIVGGEHADFPLQRRDGNTWGEIVGTSSDSFVFDTSQMTVEARSQWFTDFAETLLRKNRGPLVFVLDEAHLFAPQGGARSGGSAPAMLHATNNLLSLGRSKGLRITMISQRPAKLHKDSLTQAHTLIAMMVTAPQDRNAVKDWIADQADDGAGQEVIKSLSGLAPGEGWVWAPREHVLERVKFAWPKTFDSSSAPDSDPDDGPKLTPIDPGAIKGLLEKVAKEKVANDPAALRAEIAKLKHEMAGLGIDQTEIQKAFERGRAEGHLTGISSGRNHILGVMDEMRNDVMGAMDRHMAEANRLSNKAFNEAQAAPKATTIRVTPVAGSIKPGDKIIERVQPDRVAVVPKWPEAANLQDRAALFQQMRGTGTLPGPQQKIVDAIRWWNVLMPGAAPTHAQVAFIAGYSHKSGTWANYLSLLRTGGMLAPKGDLVLTAEGTAAANDPAAAPTTEALHRAVMTKLGGPQQRILDPLLRAYPDAMTHEGLAGTAGYSHKSGTWANYLSTLRTLDLIEKKGDLRAQAWLFPA